MTMRIGYMIGSLSASSINRKLVHGLSELASAHDGGGEDLALTEVEIADLPLYDRELDRDMPEPALRLKRSIADSDAIIIATPEYNRSIPGVLKNAIDWASRPYGQGSFAGKPVGIIGASPSAIGTAVGQQHLRTILAHLDARTLGQPEAFIEWRKDRFAADGTVTDPSTREFLSNWLEAVVRWTHACGAAADAR